MGPLDSTLIKSSSSVLESSLLTIRISVLRGAPLKNEDENENLLNASLPVNVREELTNNPPLSNSLSRANYGINLRISVYVNSVMVATSTRNLIATSTRNYPATRFALEFANI
jgi:hypothetical protein